MTVISRRTAVLGGAGLLILPLAARPVFAEPRIGAPAPAFTGLDSNGKPLTLDDLKGKTVVLEWTNHECPFVRRHYTSDNMQSLQRRWTERGVIWLSIVSSAPGEEGNVTPEEANKLTVSRNAKPTAVLLDPQQAIAHAYGAKTTPHMFIIDPTGRLVYMGGIDDKPSIAHRGQCGGTQFRRCRAHRTCWRPAGFDAGDALLWLFRQIYVLTRATPRGRGARTRRKDTFRVRRVFALRSRPAKPAGTTPCRACGPDGSTADIAPGGRIARSGTDRGGHT